MTAAYGQISLDQCEELFLRIKNSENPEELIKTYKILFKHYPPLQFSLGRGAIFWRARKCSSENGYTTTSQVSPPPPERTGAGRLNNPGEPVLYAATKEETAIAELDIAEGDTVQVSGLRILPDKEVRLLAIGDFFHIYKKGFSKIFGADPNNSVSRFLNSFPLHHGKSIIYIDAFLREILSDKKAKELLYNRTRSIVNALTLTQLQFDGCIYPSTKNDSGLNLYAKIDAFKSKFHITSSKLVKIKKIRSYGIYELEVTKQATGLKNDGTFIWQSSNTDQQYLFGLTDDEIELHQKNNSALTPDSFRTFKNIHNR